MNMINENNQALKKYIVSPKNINDYSPEQVDIKEYSSINSNPPRGEELNDYFSGGYNNSKKPGYQIPPLVSQSNDKWS